MHMHHHHHLESTTVAAAAASIPTHQLSARAEQLRTPAGALSSSGAMRCTAPSSKTDAEMCGDPRILDEKNLDWRLERTLASSSSSSSSPDRRPRDAKKPKAATKRGERAASRRYRKATYYVRKEEKEELQKQIERLQAQVQSLTEASTDPFKMNVCRQRDLANVLLRDAVHEQESSIASVQSALAGYLSKQERIPYESKICLGKDWYERHATLLAMKDKKLQDAMRYLTERTRFLDPTSPFAESSRYATPSGEYCSLRVDITPFEGAESTKQVFDAFQFFFFNMEISVTEILGDITIREDDGSWKQGVSQSRVVSSIGSGVQVEMNSAMFCEFYEHNEAYGGGRACGVIAADFVDEDELYPYSPEERVRQEVTAVLMVTSEVRKKINAAGEEEDELVVVVSRSCFLKLRHTDLPIAPHVVQELRDNLGSWGDVMLTKAREFVYHQPHQDSDQLKSI